jgi:hypothetical protein
MAPRLGARIKRRTSHYQLHSTTAGDWAEDAASAHQTGLEGDELYAVHGSSGMVFFDTCEEDSDGNSAFAHAVDWGDLKVLEALIMCDPNEWWPAPWTGVVEARIQGDTEDDVDTLHAVFQVGSV